jgi:hypothetical protein
VAFPHAEGDHTEPARETRGVGPSLSRTKVPHLATDGELFSLENKDRTFDENPIIFLFLDRVLTTTIVIEGST